jgi:hypothetical protein
MLFVGRNVCGCLVLWYAPVVSEASSLALLCGSLDWENRRIKQRSRPLNSAPIAPEHGVYVNTSESAQERDHKDPTALPPSRPGCRSPHPKCSKPLVCVAPLSPASSRSERIILHESTSQFRHQLPDLHLDRASACLLVGLR